MNPFVEECKPNYNLTTAAAGENFENLPFLIKFGVLFFPAIGEGPNPAMLMSRKETELQMAAAGEIFENSRFLIHFGALFLQIASEIS